MNFEKQIETTHNSMIDSILRMFLKKEPTLSDYRSTKLVSGSSEDGTKQFYNVSYRVDEDLKLLGTVNVEDCDFKLPISPENKFTLAFVPVMEGMESITVHLDI